MDNIDTLIIERLGEHQRKVNFVVNNIKRNEPKRHPFKKTTYLVMSVAACVALILAVSPILFKDNSIADMSIPSPSFDGYRGSANNDIERLINEGDFENALIEVESELSECYNELSMENRYKAAPEELEYMKSMQISGIEELSWCKIYILVRLDKKREVEKACCNYLENGELSAHREDVERILKEIQ